MTSLITGGAGFVGAAVARLLLERGENKPVIFSRNPNTQRLSDVADRIETVSGDLGHFSHVLDAVKQTRPDVIYHLGAMLPRYAEGDPAGAIQANAIGTYHVLEAARLLDVPQVLFASSFGVYGDGIKGDVVDDYSPQFPNFMYGVTKVFGEMLGRFYKGKYGLDFRGIRYPYIVGAEYAGPRSMFSYARMAVIECAKGNPYTILVKPEVRLPIMYIKDAARAIVVLGEAPLENIKTVNYVMNGITPSPSAQEFADMVRAKIPGARIDFKPETDPIEILGDIFKPTDDSNAQNEWYWKAEYDLEKMVEDFVQNLD